MRYLTLLTEVVKSRKKKREPSLPLVFSRAVVNTDLRPKGSVLANGELWNAQTLRGNSIASQREVTIVGFNNHLLLVEDNS